MNSETLQALRSEIEAVTTLQLALNRIAHSVDGDSLSTWDGPRAEDVDDVAADDGSFSREAVTELRRKAGESLARRYTEVERVIMGRAALESLARGVLGTGTGGVITAEGPPPSQVLSALARSGAIRLDWAQEAAVHVRDVLEGLAPKPAAVAKPVVKKKSAPKKKAPAAKAKPAKKKVVAKKKPVAAKKVKKPAPKKKPAPRKKK